MGAATTFQKRTARNCAHRLKFNPFKIVSSYRHLDYSGISVICVLYVTFIFRQKFLDIINFFNLIFLKHPGGGTEA
jgi:hypothetical protein